MSRENPVRHAVLDIGSFSVLLLVAEGVPGTRNWHPVYQKLVTTGLGEGLARQDTLRPEAIHRTVRAVCALAQEARQQGAQRVWAYGTRPLRRARNAVDFIKAVRRACGLRVETLSEQEEAELAFWAARWFLPEAPDPLLAVDLGGASTELTLGTRTQIHWSLSLPEGALTLTETHLHHDPPTPEEIQALRRHLADRLRPLATLRRPAALAGTGGTVTTLAAVLLGLTTYDGRRVHGTRWPLADLETLAHRLSRLPQAERQRLLPFDPDRARIIVAGAWFTVALLEATGLPELWVSDYGPRHAYLVRKSQTA